MYIIGGDYEDLIQEGTIGLFKAIRDFDTSKCVPFEKFADLCIQRQLYTAIKTANRKKHSPLNEYISIDASYETSNNVFDFFVSSPSPEQIVESEENKDKINKLIKSKLSNMEYKVIQLFLQGKNYKEIAQILNKKDKAIDNALQRTRSKLKMILKTSDKKTQ